MFRFFLNFHWNSKFSSIFIEILNFLQFSLKFSIFQFFFIFIHFHSFSLISALPHSLSLKKKKRSFESWILIFIHVHSFSFIFTHFRNANARTPHSWSLKKKKRSLESWIQILFIFVHKFLTWILTKKFKASLLRALLTVLACSAKPHFTEYNLLNSAKPHFT